MPSKRKGMFVFVLLALSAIMFSACVAPPTVEPEATAQAEAGPVDETPRRGGSLRIGLEGEPDTLDPHYLLTTAAMRPMELMYSTLVSLDENLNFVPDLATRWESSEDGTTFTFFLRQGVTFWCNGREMVAQDVKYSIERLASPEGASPWNYAWTALDRVEVVDDYTVRIVMKEPSAHLLAQIATSWTAIVPQEFVEANGGSLKTAACGTGPFKLVEWVPYQRVTMVRNEDYYNPDLPYLDELIWVPVQDESTRVQQTIAGELDVDLFAKPKFLSTYRNAEGIELIGGPVVSYHYLGLNAAREPFDDQRVRQAVAWAIDRDELVSLVLFGEGVPLKGGLIGPESHWAYSDIVVYPEQDLEKARQLLTEAGYPDGIQVELLADAGTIFEEVATIVKEQLAEAGIEVEILAMESAAATNKLWVERDFDMVAQQWGTWIDPDDFLFGEFHTQGDWNPFGCGNEEIDGMLEQGRAILDPEERKALYREIERLIAEHACYVLTFRDNRYAAVQEYVRGLVHEPSDERLWLREVWLDKP